MYGTRASEIRFDANAVLAICIRERIPGCSVDFPLVDIDTTGSLLRAALSNAKAIFSPATPPRLLPTNRKSSTIKTTGYPSILQVPVTTASVSPVLLCFAIDRFFDPRRALRLWDGTYTIDRCDSVNVPESAVIEILSLAVRLQW